MALNDKQFNELKKRLQKQSGPQSGGSFSQRTKDIAGQGIETMKRGFSQAKEAKNPLEALESGITFGAGAVETAFSPLSGAVEPITRPIGKAISSVSNKISDIPAVQKFASSKVGQTTARLAENVSNLNTIAGAATTPMGVSRATGSVANTVRNVGAVGVKATQKVANAAGNQPAKIMQRVARISKSKQAKFEQMAGEGVGDYLVKRGIYGNVDEISEQLYKRFSQSKSVADDSLAQLKGTFEPAPVRTALKELFERELRTSSPGAKSPILSEIKGLMAKSGKGGWTMAEINQIKRLYERNVRVDYLKQNLPESVARANNIDNAIRSWQFSQAEKLGLKNLPKINKETQLSKQLLDELGKEYSGAAGNNAMTLTDWIMLSGGDPTAIAGFLTKKTFSSKGVQSALAKYLNRGKGVMGDVKADIGPSKVLGLPAPSGQLRSTSGSGKPIKVGPKGSSMEYTGR